MIKQIRITLVILIIFMVSGCNGDKASLALSNTIDSALIASSGNKPPKHFAFASPHRANGYVMQHKDYSFTMPLTKASDWSKMSGWYGSSDFQGMGIAMNNSDTRMGIVLGYNIHISSSVGNYSERKKAIERKDQSYINNVRVKYHYPHSTKLYYGNLGKENYSCIIKERIDKRGRKRKNYDCYKFNYSHTKSKNINITLSYYESKNLPAKYNSLAKQYTYTDLKRRAKRMLDSLYIKDGW